MGLILLAFLFGVAVTIGAVYVYTREMTIDDGTSVHHSGHVLWIRPVQKLDARLHWNHDIRLERSWGGNNHRVQREFPR